MKITIGVPGSGTTVELELDNPTNDPKAYKSRVREALEALKVAGDTWVEWSRENETPEQTEMRELMEQNAELKKRAVAAENVRLEEMLSGRTDGIRAGDM